MVGQPEPAKSATRPWLRIPVATGGSPPGASPKGRLPRPAQPLDAELLPPEWTLPPPRVPSDRFAEFGGPLTSIRDTAGSNPLVWMPPDSRGPLFKEVSHAFHHAWHRTPAPQCGARAR